MDGIANVDMEFVYPREYFLQRINEEVYRCNRRSQCFLWIEIPFKGFVYDEAWKIAVQTMLSKEYMCAAGQGKDCLWSLYTNRDLCFLETIKKDVEENLSKAGLLESVSVMFNFNAYFYSGKSQSFIQEENRFMKKWNSKLSFLRVKRISIEYIKEKTFHGLYSKLLKRIIDIAGSLFGIFLFFWVMLLCAILVKHSLLRWNAEQKKLGNVPAKNTSVLFKQVRVGRDGRLFKCYKFRTMYPGADKEKEKLRELQDMENGGVKRGPTFKMDDDPRILKYGGAFLRRHSLDELPQFFNVLIGDMSLVGPRPPTPDEVKKYEAWHYIRLSVKPGLTCIWQTSGRNSINFDEWMRLDNRYVIDRNTLTDLNLKIKTIEVMINGKGAS